MALIDGTFNGRYAESINYIEQEIRPKVLWAIDKDDGSLQYTNTTPFGY
jgi:hypothetical protein